MEDIKIRLPGLRVGPKFNDVCPHKRQKKEKTQTHRGEGHVDRGRDWSDAATRPGTPRTARSQERGRDGFSLRASKRNQPRQHLDFRLLASSTAREDISVALKAPGLRSFVTAALGK